MKKTNYKEHKHSVGKWIIFILVILTHLAAILIGYFTFGYRDWSFGGSQEPPKMEMPNEGGEETPIASAGAIIGEAEEHGIRMISEVIEREAYEESGVSAQADSAYTLTATVEPADTTFKDMAWSVAWANAESEWATGKTVTDYMTIAATDNTATVTCLQAFGEPIIITAALTFDENIKATCQCDYVKSISNHFSFETGANLSAILKKVGSTSTVRSVYVNNNEVKHSYTFFVRDIQYGVGTVQGELVFSDEYYAYCPSGMFIQLINRFRDFGLTMKADLLPLAELNNNSSYLSDGVFSFNLDFFRDVFGSRVDGVDALTDEQLIAYLMDAANGNATFKLQKNFKYVYNNAIVREGVVRLSDASADSTLMKFSMSEFNVPTGVTTDQNELVFYAAQ